MSAGLSVTMYLTSSAAWCPSKSVSQDAQTLIPATSATASGTKEASHLAQQALVQTISQRILLLEEIMARVTKGSIPEIQEAKASTRGMWMDVVLAAVVMVDKALTR